MLVIINWDDAECVLYSIQHKRGSLVATAVILLNMLSLCVAQGEHLVGTLTSNLLDFSSNKKLFTVIFNLLCLRAVFVLVARINNILPFLCYHLDFWALEILDQSGICVNCPEAGCSVVFSNVLWLCQMFTVKLILSGDGVQDCGVSDAVSQGFLSPLQLVSTVSGLCAWLTQPDSLLLSSTSTNLSSLFYKLHYRLLLLIVSYLLD